MKQTLFLYERFLQMLDGITMDFDDNLNIDDYILTVKDQMNSVLKGVKVSVRGFKNCKIKRMIWMGWTIQLVIQFNKSNSSGVFTRHEINFQ